VLAGSSPEALTPLTTVPRDGFQTTIPVSALAGTYVAARALGTSGQVLGTSTAQPVP